MLIFKRENVEAILSHVVEEEKWCHHYQLFCCRITIFLSTGRVTNILLPSILSREASTKLSVFPLKWMSTRCKPGQCDIVVGFCILNRDIKRAKQNYHIHSRCMPLLRLLTTFHHPGDHTGPWLLWFWTLFFSVSFTSVSPPHPHQSLLSPLINRIIISCLPPIKNHSIQLAMCRIRQGLFEFGGSIMPTLYPFLIPA